MVPKALREFEAKLKTLQNMVYRGEIHEIATGGMPKVRREAEAYLEERRLAREIRQGRYPAAECLADGGPVEAKIKAKYQAKVKGGWPNLLMKQTEDNPAFPGVKVYQTVASFHGEIEALDASALAGKTLYRAFGKASTHASESFAGGMFWGMGSIPKTAEEWRIHSAVLDEWNGNGFIAILHFPPDLENAMSTAKGWAGQIAEQFGSKLPNRKRQRIPS
ncbi:hypothetical protein [Paraburkholderia sp. D1E]|uniref:hypothetical protein n=1 Tax=Paraburkholderia sp. D1E TaxID=3461398 RepID=UPI004045CBB3